MATLAVLALCLPQAAPAPQLVADLNLAPATPNDVVRLLGTAHGSLWFNGFQPDLTFSEIGHSAWVVDPAVGPPTVVGPLSTLGGAPQEIEHVVEFGTGKTLLASSFGVKRQLWVVDATGQAPVELLTTYAGDFVDLLAFGGWGYALTGGGDLYSTDGTPAGTSLLETTATAPTGSGVLSDAAGEFLHATPAGVAFLTRPFPSTTGAVEFRLIADPQSASAPFFSVSALDFGDLKQWVGAGGRIHFGRRDAATGLEPWVSDGTAAGTVSLGDLALGPESSAPLFGAGDGDEVFFTATTPATGREVWTTSGTPATTRLFAEAVPGPGGSGVEPQWLAPVTRGVAFFAATPGVGLEPWISDGTASGTQLFADLTPGPEGSVPIGRVRSGADLVGALIDVDSGSRGMPVVLDTARGGIGRFPQDALSDPSDGWGFLGGRAYTPLTSEFVQRQLWESDGSSAGTRRVLEPLALHESGNSSLGFPFGVGGAAAFGSSAPRSSAGLARAPLLVARPPRSRLASTDGVRVELLEEEPTFWSLAGRFGQRFAAWQGEHGSPPELRLSDGSPGGTLALTGAGERPIEMPFEPAPLGAEVGTRFVFTGRTPLTGDEPFVTDGTPEGTVLLIDSAPGTESSRPSYGGLLNGRLVFSTEFKVSSPFGLLTKGRIWTTDGTPGGTALVAELDSPVRSLTRAIGGYVYFLDQNSSQLWRTDGTLQGTQNGIDFVVGATSSPTGGDLAAAGDRVLLFKSKGVSSIDPAGNERIELTGYPVSRLTGDATNVYVSESSATLSPTWRRIWQVDGLEPPRLVVQDVLNNSFPVLGDEMIPVGSDGTALGVRTTVERGAEPFLAEGGTGLLIDLPEVFPGPQSGAPSIAAQRLGNQLLLMLDDGVVGRELFSYGIAELGTYVAEPFGTGCGLGVPPTLDLQGEARLGASVSVRLARSQPDVPAFLLAGAQPASTPVGACTLLLDAVLPIVAGTTNSTGAVSWPFQLSSDPYWLNRELYLQAATVVPGGPAVSAFELSNGLELVFGQ